MAANDHIPTVQIRAEDRFSESLTSLARTFVQMGDEDLATDILSDKKKLKINSQQSVEYIAKDEAAAAEKLIKERQYHSKSGYIGHGNLAHSIQIDSVDGEQACDIYPTATNDGYNYGQAFEFGLKTKNYPA
ncbi:hypothetical protein EQ500_09020, partial [Lactobacillus sp. XV13L]|nr:hypothetical protein [Lactobacillus sp. XV13L]